MSVFFCPYLSWHNFCFIKVTQSTPFDRLCLIQMNLNFVRTTPTKDEIRFFKRVSIVGVILLVILTVIYASTSTMYSEDRPLFRIGIILSLIALYVGCDYSSFIRKNYHYLFYVINCAYITGGIYVLYVNGFPLFEIGTTTLVALIMCLLFKGRLELFLYLCVVFSAFVGFYNISEVQPVPIGFFIFVMFSLCSFSYITFAGRIKMMEELKYQKDQSLQKERQFKYLFDHSPHGIILYSNDFEVRRMNMAMLEMLGLTKADREGFSLPEHVHEEDLIGQEEIEQLIAAADPAPAKLEQRYYQKDKSLIWVNVSLCNIWDIDWGDIRYMAMFEDVTEKKKMQIQLEEAANDLRNHNQALSEFTHVISHDLQEPLRMVKSYSNLIKRKYISKIDDRRATMDFDYVIDGADHMSNLIKDMLSYSRVSAKSFDLEAVDLMRLIHKVLQNLTVQIQETEAEVFCVDMPTLMCNQTLLGQVMQNIISNGIKYNRPEQRPVIKIAVEQKQDHYLFSIGDNGQGFGEHEKERIFGIF